MAGLIWVTGAGGLIGKQIVHLAATEAVAWPVRGLTREQLDLCDFPAVQKRFEAERPEVIIHCGAMSKSPDCESNPALAWRTNFESTKHLADLAGHARLIFFSTDLVFDGRTGNYAESAEPNPLSVYGRTKVAAEQAVLHYPQHTVIRTSLNGGTSPTGDRGFNEQLRLAWQRGQRTRLFTDEFRSPIAARVTAAAVWQIVARNAQGLFHIAGSERLSRWQIGKLLADRWPQLHPKLEAASLKEYTGPARPPDTTLNCCKFQNQLSFSLPAFSAWLTESATEQF